MRRYAPEKQIKDNYKVLSLKLHPDKCMNSNTSEEEKEVFEARFKGLHSAFEAGLYTLTPPDPQLKGAWYPGGFNLAPIK